MSPIDAAQRMAAYHATHDYPYACVYCGYAGHDPSCPTLALPRIVAVLEAADKVAAEYDSRSGEWALWEYMDALVAALEASDVAPIVSRGADILTGPPD